MGRRYYGTPNLFVRKHRKRLLSSPNFRAKWLQSLDRKQALKSLKQSKGKEENPNPNKADLFSSLLNSFSISVLHPTPQAYLFLVKHLAHNLQSHQLPSVLDHLQHNENFPTPEIVFIRIIRIFGNSDRIEEAINVFYRIPRFRCVPSVHSLNALLSVLCRNELGLRMVPQVLLNARRMGIRLEESSFRILINGLCRINKVGFAVELLNCMTNDGFFVDDKICSLLLSAVYLDRDLGDVEVMGLFEGLRKMGFCPGIGDYTNVVRFLVKKRKGKVALDVLTKMKNDGIKPDVICYTMVLNGVILEGDFVKADQLFDELLVLGLVPDVYTYNVYIDGFCKRNKLEEGIKMVACMDELGCRPNVVTYNILLDAFCSVGETSRALGLLREMEFRGIEQNWGTYKVIINALLNKGEIIEARNLLEEVLCKGISHQSLTFDHVICCFCQRGLACDAIDLVIKMVGSCVYPGTRAWEAILSSSGLKLDFVETTWTDLVDPD